jgi:sugar phosphate permease
LSSNPYGRSSPVRVALVRVHTVAVLLSVAQTTLMTFSFVWLHSYHHWSSPAAGGVIMLANMLGIGSRIGCGIWSDSIGSRMRPLRVIACASAMAMGLLALDDALLGVFAAPFMVTASVIASADRGLVFTAALEVAGRQWGGRSLGLQNTFQFLAAAAIPPVFGALITATGYSAAFGVAAACAGLALVLVPADTNDWQ